MQIYGGLRRFENCAGIGSINCFNIRKFCILLKVSDRDRLGNRYTIHAYDIRKYNPVNNYGLKAINWQILKNSKTTEIFGNSTINILMFFENSVMYILIEF